MTSTIIPFPARKPPGITRRKPKVQVETALKCAAALEMVGAGIRSLNEHLPCAGLPDYAPLLKRLWSELPAIEAAATMIEDRALGMERA